MSHFLWTSVEEGMKGPTGVLLIMGLEIQLLGMSSLLFWVSLICFASLLRTALSVVSLINNVSYSVTHKQWSTYRSIIKSKICVTSRISSNGENGKKGKKKNAWVMAIQIGCQNWPLGEWRFRRKRVAILAKMANLVEMEKNRQAPREWRFWWKWEIWHNWRKIARGLAISRIWQIFKRDAKSGSCVSGNVSHNRVIPWRVHLLTTC